MFESIVNFVKLTDTAQTPTQGSEQAAGWDLYADIDGNYTSLLPGEIRKISTGISIALPEGTFGAIFARSGLSTKKGLAPANKVGVIDSDYRGPIIVALKNESNQVQTVEHGERIAQLVVIPYCPIILNEAKVLPSTERGTGGFGSTGMK